MRIFNSAKEPAQFGPRPIESWATMSYRLYKLCFRHPCYYLCGARTTCLSADWREYRVRLQLGFFTRNPIGTIFGGSICAAADPHFNLLLMHALGEQYVVVDHEKRARFDKVSRTMFIRFVLTEERIEAIKKEAENAWKIFPEFTAEWLNSAGEVMAVTTHKIYVHKRTKDQLEQYRRQKKGRFMQRFWPEP